MPKWVPNLQMEETDWAYLAGLIDGEGHVAVSCRSPRHSGSRQLTPQVSYRPIITVVDTNRDVLEWLKACLGGNIAPKKLIKKHKQSWVWRLQRIEAIQHTCQKCLPYFKIKRLQAELVLRFPGYVLANQWTDPVDLAEIRKLKLTLYQGSRSLNKRGG